MRLSILCLLMVILGQLQAVEAPALTYPPTANAASPIADANAALPKRIMQTVLGPLAPTVAPTVAPPPLLARPADNSGGGSSVITAPGLTIALGTDAKRGWSTPVLLLLGVTALSVAPAFLMMMTSFTRIIIVLGFLRRALGTQSLPPNQVMAGLALFLSLFIMTPTFNRINDTALQPYLKESISQEVAFNATKDALRDFMLKQTRKNDLALFIRLAKEERPRTAADVSFMTLVPAFMTSELKTAFQMGFIIFLPFLVIDLVVSAVLMALGMMMLPPVVVSLPFKILLFCLVDGWTLLMQALVSSYR